MEPHIFTDAAGRAWSVIDYKVIDGTKKRVALGSWTADDRAFVPDGWEGPVMLRHFIAADSRETQPKVLQGHLSFAKPSTTMPAERIPSEAR
jgi:hypothetical protein